MKSLLSLTAIILSFSANLAEAGGKTSSLKRALKSAKHVLLDPGPFSKYNFKRFPTEFRDHKHPAAEDAYNRTHLFNAFQCPEWERAQFSLKSAVGRFVDPSDKKQEKQAMRLKDLNTITLTYIVTDNKLHERGTTFSYCGTVTVEKSFANDKDNTKGKPVWGEPNFHFDEQAPRQMYYGAIPERILKELMDSDTALSRAKWVFDETYKRKKQIKQGFMEARLLVDNFGRPSYEFAGVNGIFEGECINIPMEVEPLKNHPDHYDCLATQGLSTCVTLEAGKRRGISPTLPQKYWEKARKSWHFPIFSPCGSFIREQSLEEQLHKRIYTATVK